MPCIENSTCAYTPTTLLSVRTRTVRPPRKQAVRRRGHRGDLPTARRYSTAATRIAASATGWNVHAVTAADQDSGIAAGVMRVGSVG